MKIVVWDVLTVAVLVLTCICGLFYLVIFMQPDSSLNLFPPPTAPVAMRLPTITETPRSLPPTWTQEVQVLPSNTPKPTSTETPTITPTPTETLSPTPTETATPTLSPTNTLVPTRTRTYTHTPDMTSVYAGYMTQTAQALAQLTNDALQKTKDQYTNLTQAAAQKTAAAAQLTAAARTATKIASMTAYVQTRTAAFIQTTVAAPTKTLAAILTGTARVTQTAVAGTATATSVTATMSARATAIFQAPIAYSISALATPAGAAYIPRAAEIQTFAGVRYDPANPGSPIAWGSYSLGALANKMPMYGWTNSGGWSLYFSINSPGSSLYVIVGPNTFGTHTSLPGQPQPNYYTSMAAINGGGSWIIFSSTTNPGTNPRELWRLRPNGSDLQRLTSDGFDDRDASWKDDSTALFVSDREGPGTANIFAINVDSPSSITALTSGLTTMKAWPRYCKSTVWNTGTKQWTTYEKIAYSLWNGFQWDVYVGDANNLNSVDPNVAKNLTNTTGAVGPGQYINETWPTWSPYCTYVAFRRENQSDANPFDIWVVRSDGSNWPGSSVTDPATIEYCPVWRPQ